jgi:hypothetical protein
MVYSMLTHNHRGSGRVIWRENPAIFSPTLTSFPVFNYQPWSAHFSYLPNGKPSKSLISHFLGLSLVASRITLLRTHVRDRASAGREALSLLEFGGFKAAAQHQDLRPVGFHRGCPSVNKHKRGFAMFIDGFPWFYWGFPSVHGEWCQRNLILSWWMDGWYH